VTVSVGGVTFTALPETVEQMVQRADARMYEAKSNGKDRVLLEVADGTATSPVPPRSPPEAESESR